MYGNGREVLTVATEEISVYEEIGVYKAITPNGVEYLTEYDDPVEGVARCISELAENVESIFQSALTDDEPKPNTFVVTFDCKERISIRHESGKVHSVILLELTPQERIQLFRDLVRIHKPVSD